MAKFPEAQERIFKNVFVCKNCKKKQRSIPKKILEEKLSCKRCGSKSFRPLRRVK